MLSSQKGVWIFLLNLKVITFSSAQSTAGDSNKRTEMLKETPRFCVMAGLLHLPYIQLTSPQTIPSVGRVSILFLYGICNIHIHVHMSRSREQVTKQAHEIRYVPLGVHNITKKFFFSLFKKPIWNFMGCIQDNWNVNWEIRSQVLTHSVQQNNIFRFYGWLGFFWGGSGVGGVLGGVCGLENLIVNRKFWLNLFLQM